MGLRGKLEAQLEIKASPSMYREIISHRSHNVSNATPGNVKGCTLHEGNWGTPGSIIEWTYVHDGKTCSAKEVVEVVDEEKHLVTKKVVGGDLLEEYKSFKITFQATPKGGAGGGGAALAKCTFEYEKINDTVRHPTSFLELMMEVMEDIDGHLTK